MSGWHLAVGQLSTGDDVSALDLLAYDYIREAAPVGRQPAALGVVPSHHLTANARSRHNLLAALLVLLHR